MNNTLKQAIDHWKYISPLVSMPKNDKEYDKLASYLDMLLDLCGTDESHPLRDMINVISDVIQHYDEMHYPIPEGTGIEALRYLMEQHGLTQGDLSDIGSQGVVSDILRGARPLNVRQVKCLKKRFNVSADTFI